MRAFLLAAGLVLAALPVSSLAQDPAVGTIPMPADACYRMSLTQPELAARPGRGVAALTIEFRPLTAWERAGPGYWRHVRIAARMASQGQGLRDAVAGAVLTATAECRAQTMTCWSDGDAAHFSVRLKKGEQLALSTRHFPVADFGGSMTASNLAEHADRATVYLLDPVPMHDCDLN